MILRPEFMDLYLIGFSEDWSLKSLKRWLKVLLKGTVSQTEFLFEFSWHYKVKYLYPLFLCQMIEMEALFVNRMRFTGWSGFIMKILICIDGLGLFNHSKDESFYSLFMRVYESGLIFWPKNKSTLFKL